MDKLTIILIVISAVLAVFTAYFQYFFKVKEKSQYMYWLSFFRAITLFSLLLLIINPSLKKINYTYIKPSLKVVLDNSKSIEFLKNNESVTSFLDSFQSDLDLSEKFDIKYFKFGSNVTVLDSLNFTDNYSNISKVFSTLSEISSETSDAIILLTDGNETTGRSTFKSGSNSIIYPVIVGDTTIYEDLYVDRLNVNPTTFLNNNAPVEVFVNYSGTNEITGDLNLYQGNTKIGSKSVLLNRTQNTTSVSFFIPALKEGRHYYSARITPLENEKNKENNIKTFSLNVIQEQAKIAVLSEMIHPDLGMLKATIASKKEREVALKEIGDSFDLSDFDLVILYQPTRKFEAVMKRLAEDEINYLLISGLSTDWDFLNGVQSNYARQSIASEENFGAIFNEDYSTFLTEPIDVAEWPPLQHSYGKLQINPRFNTLLHQNVGGIQTKEAILGTFETGNQKVGLWMGENIWRWRMYSFKETGDFEQFDSFFSNLIQYLSSKKQKNRLNVSHKELFYANESIEFTASYLDDNLNFDSKAQLELTVFNSAGGFTRTVPFIGYSSTFKASLSDLSEGTYNYIVKVVGEAISISGSFNVAPYNLEEQFSSSQYKKLQTISEESGGKLYFQNDFEQLSKKLKSDTRFSIIQIENEEKTPLIEWHFLLIAIVLSLGLEWFVRKYFGKI